MDLNEVVKSRARVEGALILVDDFLNHRVEPAVIRTAEALVDSLDGGIVRLRDPR